MSKEDKKAKKEETPLSDDDLDLYLENLDKIKRHIQLVQDACYKLGVSLIKRGEKEFGRNLIANSFIHDNSKFFGIEWKCLNQDADKEKLALAHEQHVGTNPHHPEFWGHVNDMPRIMVAEMVCDWKARSDEFGSDLRSWIKKTAFEKYNIPKTGKVAKQINEFLNLLLEKPFSNIG